jgi:putative iron-dependent peroxidase
MGGQGCSASQLLTSYAPVAPIRGHRYDVPTTPGDVFLHIRSDRADLCSELATRIPARLDGALTAVDEVQGFRYFDDRNLLGFGTDGTPKGVTAFAAALVGAHDPAFEGGTFVVVQKYLHDLTAWNGLLRRSPATCGSMHRSVR